jgi:dihydroflavonol-4-reductase
MTTLLTGASGFVGSAVLRQLLDAGTEVRVLVRSTSSRSNLEGLPVEIVTGDLRDEASLKKAIRGCNALYHVAADYRLWTPNPQELYEANVNGSRNLMHAALDNQVDRIVYTSSVATLGLHKDGSPADELTPSTIDDMVGHYKRSKFLAEVAVKHMIDHEGLPAVIVNPSTPVGPRDHRPTPTGRMVLDAQCGRMPAFVDTGLNIAHVDDVARGHLLAFEKGCIGERYILGGEDMMLREILASIAELTGQKAPTIRLPLNLIFPVAWFSEAWARMTHGPEPRVTADGLRMARKLMFFSSRKAQVELGYQPRPALEALKDAIDWFQDHDYCQRKL